MKEWLIITLTRKSKFWYFQSKNPLYWFSQWSQNISCIFFHQCYRLHFKSLYRNTTKKQLCLLERHKTNLTVAVSEERNSIVGEQKKRLSTEYPFIPSEFYTVWMYYLFLKTCLTKLFQVSDIPGFCKPESILALKKCGVHVNGTPP